MFGSKTKASYANLKLDNFQIGKTKKHGCFPLEVKWNVLQAAFEMIKVLPSNIVNLNAQSLYLAKFVAKFHRLIDNVFHYILVELESNVKFVKD